MHQVNDGLPLFRLAFWLVFFVAYWLPTLVAFLRNIREKPAVIVLNVFGFVLGIPWVIALVLASFGARLQSAAPPPTAPPAT